MFNWFNHHDCQCQSPVDHGIDAPTKIIQAQWDSSLLSQPSRPGVLAGEAPPDEHSEPLLLSLSQGGLDDSCFSKHKNKVLMLLKMQIYVLNSFLVPAQEVKPDREPPG